MAIADVVQLKVEQTVLDLIKRERKRALSLREWKFRLAGHGYEIKEVGGHHILRSLTRGTDLGVLPASVC